MAIGKIYGPMLNDNLDRNGVDLSIDTNLVFFDVINRRLGINTISPAYPLDVAGTAHFGNIVVNLDTLVSDTGKLRFGSNANVSITGGNPLNILFTDGNGNLTWSDVNSLMNNAGLEANSITLGTPTVGSLSSVLPFTTATYVADAISEINQLLGNITNASGTQLQAATVTANVLTSTSINGVLLTSAQPYVTTVGILSNLEVAGNLVVDGPLLSNSFITTDNIIEIHAPQNLGAWTFDDGKDIGTKFHYYNGSDNYAFLGRTADTGYLEWYSSGSEIGNVFVGTYGTIKSGDLHVANVTPSNSAYTGALLVAGGTGIQGNLYVGGQLVVTGPITASTLSVNGLSSTGNIYGTLGTSYQPYITQVGTLLNLVETGTASIDGVILSNANVFATNLTGTLTTVNQPNITTVGTLYNLAVLGNVTANSIFAPYIGGLGTTFTGTLSTSSQPNITSLGTLTSLSVSGNVTAPQFTGNVVTDYIFSLTSGLTIEPNNGIVQIDSTTALQIPTGNTIQRPSANVAGYVRFNSDLSTIEYYDGYEWAPVNNVISNQFINGDGVTQTFTLNQATTTEAILVSINGTIQQPGVAYTVIGNQITFTEIPLATDVIDIRYLATAVAINLNTVVIETAPLLVNTAPTLVDSFNADIYRSAKYTISSANPYDAHMADVKVVQFGGNAAIYPLALDTGANTITYTANVTGNIVNVYAYGTTSLNSMRIERAYFIV
jgi:hypothetical protein